jgi:PAS domain S-box-containing protein
MRYKEAQIPECEEQRINALLRYRVLDTEREQAFDDLVELAREICSTPIALISLVERTRQWFKAKVGLCVNETSRSVSFCSHAILDDSIMIVPDATKDDRFLNNPLVVGDPFIRFYAGVPLITPDGYSIGTLCVIAPTPGSLSERQKNCLKILANQVVSQLELRAKGFEVESSEARYRALCDASPLGVYGTDISGNCTYVNERFLEITGLSYADCCARGWLKSVHPDDREEVDRQWYEAILERRIYESTHRFIRPDGGITWCRVKAAESIERGSLVGYVGVLDDITTEKEAENRLKVATLACGVGIWMWKANDNYLWWDDLMFDIYGVDRRDFKATYNDWYDRVHPNDVANVDMNLKQCFNADQLFNAIFRIVRPDGEIRYIQANAILERDKKGNLEQVIGTNLDITEIKERELELDCLRRAAEAATNAKGQFLANISHEIRTPLTSIIGFAEAASEEGVSEKERVQALATILANGNHLLGLINDILDLTKLDIGALQVEQMSVSPVRIIEDVRTLMEPRVVEKGLSLIIDYIWPLPERIISDGLRLMQVLVNLISNAVKFTEYGQVVVRVWCAPNEQRLYCSVSDSGIGIAEGVVGKLFQPFVQADASTARCYGGTGLGLSISKHLVERLAGKIWVESEKDVGSTFIFYVSTGPLQEDCKWLSEPVIEQIVESVDLQDEPLLEGRVLIAEDVPDSVRLLQFILSKTGLQLTFVENGAEAVKAALNEPFDLIILDMQMPVMDGYTAVRVMRSMGMKVPVVAFTANAFKQDMLKCLEAGCTAHLQKPVRKQDLLECIAQQLGRHDYRTRQKNKSRNYDQEAILVSLKREFIEKLELRVNTLLDCLEQRDFKKLQHLAHQLSGSAGMFGYDYLYELTVQLEENISHEKIIEVSAILEKLRQENKNLNSG